MFLFKIYAHFCKIDEKSKCSDKMNSMLKGEIFIFGYCLFYQSPRQHVSTSYLCVCVPIFFVCFASHFTYSNYPIYPLRAIRTHKNQHDQTHFQATPNRFQKSRQINKKPNESRPFERKKKKKIPESFHRGRERRKRTDLTIGGSNW